VRRQAAQRCAGPASGGAEASVCRHQRAADCHARGVKCSALRSTANGGSGGGGSGGRHRRAHRRPGHKAAAAEPRTSAAHRNDVAVRVATPTLCREPGHRRAHQGMKPRLAVFRESRCHARAQASDGFFTDSARGQPVARAQGAAQTGSTSESSVNRAATRKCTAWRTGCCRPPASSSCCASGDRPLRRRRLLGAASALPPPPSRRHQRRRLATPSTTDPSCTTRPSATATLRPRQRRC